MLKGYGEYKETGIGEIKRVPLHWKVRKLRNILKNVSIKNTSNEQLLSVTREKGIIIRDITNKEENHNFIPDDLSNYKKVSAGQFVTNKMKAWQGSYGISDYNGVVSPAYFVFDVNVDCKSFFHSAMRSKAYSLFFAKCSIGIRVGQWDLDMHMMREIPFFVPPISEQRQIVAYLKWKTAQMDFFVSAKEKEIRHLEELKKAIVNKAVAKGLNDNVPMKKTGIDWLPEVPVHWKKYRVKNMVREEINYSTTGQEKHLSMSQKYGLVTDDVDIERRLLSENYIGGKICEKDNLVLNRLKAHLGVFAVAPIKGIVSPDYTVLRILQKIVEPKFLEALLKSNSCRKELVIRVKGIVEGFWRLYTDDLGTIVVFIPDVKEQKKILFYIDKKCAEIETAIANIKKEISLVQELRTRLVADAVTGRIDVRQVAVPEEYKVV